MRALVASDLEGKTITSVDTTAVNVIKIMFTDGTSLDIWAEDAVYTPFGNIPGFSVEDQNYGKQARSTTYSSY